MKKTVLQTAGILLFSLLSSSALQAQNRQTDLEVHVTNPTAGQVFNYGDTIKLSFTIKNNGPGLLKATDTLVFEHSLSQNPVAVVVSGITNNADLPSGSTSPTATIAQATNSNTTGDKTADICLIALDVNTSGITIGGVPLHVTWDDADTANNRSCVSVTLKKQTTGIFDIKNGYESLSLSPNPANSNVSFVLDLDKAEQVSLSVRDILGREVIRKDYGKTMAGQSTPFNLDVTRIKNGMYFIELNAGSRKFKSKLSVQH